MKLHNVEYGTSCSNLLLFKIFENEWFLKINFVLTFQLNMNYFVVAASSLYHASFDAPHLFDEYEQHFFAMPGLSLNNQNPHKNIVTLLQNGTINPNGRPIVLWHDAINNSLSSKKTPSMSVTSFVNCLSRLSRDHHVRFFTYLPRSGALDLQPHFHQCPRSVTFLKMRSILTPRYRKLLASNSDLHLHYIVEATMLTRILLTPNLRNLSQQREVNRQRNLQNRVSMSLT